MWISVLNWEDFRDLAYWHCCLLPLRCLVSVTKMATVW